MPIYVFQCRRCDVRTEAFFRSLNATRTVVCEACGSEELERVFTPFAIYRSELQQLEQLDPKYFKKVDEALAHTKDADPMRHLSKMTPFDAAPDPGDPIKF
ncbi:MAG TPA: zinc ribbon domain-containing protein [Dehalococcoidia bacterium]|jgi:putative FmdB family regulatory protein|nr:zinc ribbon domain-containing protein [Dehalococcoidia bacterium]